MKTCMFTMGTRGDIEPYIILSKALLADGVEVTLGSHPCWRKPVEDAGIPFAPIGPDIDIEAEAARIRGKAGNAALSMIRTMNFIMRIIQGATKEVYEICKGCDLVIVSHSQMGAVEAQVLGIPTVNVTLQTEMIAQKGKPQSPAGRLIGSMIGKQVAKPYNRIRKVYGLLPLSSGDALMSDTLNLIPISKYVMERNPFWEDKNVLTGYWYEEAADYVPDARLTGFLSHGDAPVILSLGAMSFEDVPEKEKLDMFAHAFEKTGCRAIIQGFQKTLSDYDLPRSMFACGSVPHSWLFKQGKFVIHHCGFGTSAATLIHGIPSIPVPHVLDQMGFAKQLYDAGVSTSPLKAKDLSEAAIVNAIEEMLADHSVKKEKAEEISAKIRTEGGVKEAVRLIRQVL